MPAILERHYRDCCDIEFTIERGRLWLLQVRVGKRTPQAALRMAVDMAEDPAFPLTREEAVARVASILADPPTAVTERGSVGEPLTRGLGVSPGLVSGEVRVTAAGAIAAAETGADVILVRPETSPDDVAGMERAVGILTATGGFASHAAVVARGWGKPAVVGATEVRVGTDGVSVAGRSLPARAPSSRSTGRRARCSRASRRAQRRSCPRRRCCSAGRASSGSGSAAGRRTRRRSAAAGGDASADDAVRALLVKGYAQPDQLGHALGVACRRGAGAARRPRRGRDGRGRRRRVPAHCGGPGAGRRR